MKSSNVLLAFVATVLISSCHARTMPLASTATASGTLATSSRSSQSDDDAAGENGTRKTKGRDRKSSLRIPRLWGQGSRRRSGGNKSDSGDGGNDGTPEKSKADENSDGKPSMDMKKEEGIANDEESQSSSDPRDVTNTPESVEKEEPSGKTEAGQHSEPQATNQTRPGVVYMNIAPPTAPMVPHHHARPMQYQYIPQHQPPPPARNTPPSLLSSILSMFLPRPQNMPPSPFGPMPPSSPNGPIGNNAITSLVLRLALISLGTLILDLFGWGSHSDAFLPTPAQHYTFERVNDRYRRDGSALRQALESPPPGVRNRRWRHVFGRRKRDAVSTLMLTEELNKTGSSSLVESPSLGNGALYNRTVIILDMKPDSRVGNGMAEQLRDTVSFLIEQHRDHVDKRNNVNGIGYSSKLRLPYNLLPPYFSKASASSSSRNQLRNARGIRPALGNELEIVLFLDSPGGTVQDYGLASSHLSRLRDEPQVTLSVCVDRVAASGGYMMACQATPGHLYAAPFAMLGSIGVIMETVNVNEVLKRYGVKPLVIKAGKNKAPLKTLGEVTSEELKMAQDDADVIHTAFQEWVMKSRPDVVVSKDWIEKVCTGAVFLGKEARELGLVDRVLTSDEYVAERIAAGDRVLRLMPYRGPQFGLKISPLDLLLSGMDAKGRAKIRERIRGLGTGLLRSVASLFRVGAAVGVLNHFASLQIQSPGYYWSA